MKEMIQHNDTQSTAMDIDKNCDSLQAMTASTLSQSRPKHSLELSQGAGEIGDAAAEGGGGKDDSTTSKAANIGEQSSQEKQNGDSSSVSLKKIGDEVSKDSTSHKENDAPNSIAQQNSMNENALSEMQQIWGMNPQTEQMPDLLPIGNYSPSPKPKKRKRMLLSENDYNESSVTTVNALLPKAMLEFQNIAKAEEGSAKAFQSADRIHRRQGYSSRLLTEVEAHLKSAFFQKRQMANPVLTRPFSLEYNECSIACIAAWASKTDGENSGQAKRVFTTVPAMFRKCQICESYGHYEIECKSMTEDDALELAEKVQIYSTLQMHNDKRKRRQELPFRYMGLDHNKGSIYGLEENFSRTYLLCEVCHSGCDDDNMLICDGCEKLYHLYCLNPPLSEVPEGDWFCKSCKEYNDDVSSDVEIEVCDDFVIEQRKSRRTRDLFGGEGTFDLDWQTAAAVIPDNLKARPLAKSTPLSRSGSDYSVMGAVVDGFTILASSTSKCPHVLDRLESSRRSNMKKTIMEEDLVIGSIVAWFPPDENPSVGVVLAVDSKSSQALVREIPEWEGLLNERTREKGLEDCSVRTIQTGGTFWHAAGELHVVARAPSTTTSGKFCGEVVPARILASVNNPPKMSLSP